MLTLTRKVGETIRIGDDIEIVVKEIRKNQVRIGIVAPREVKIYREEVYDNILAERRAAATTEAPGGGNTSASANKPARPRTGSAGATTRKGSRGTTKRTGNGGGGKQSRQVDKGVKP